MIDELATAVQRLLLTAVGLKEPEPVHNDFPYLESILAFSGENAQAIICPLQR